MSVKKPIFAKKSTNCFEIMRALGFVNLTIALHNCGYQLRTTFKGYSLVWSGDRTVVHYVIPRVVSSNMIISGTAPQGLRDAQRAAFSKAFVYMFPSAGAPGMDWYTQSVEYYTTFIKPGKEIDYAKDVTAIQKKNIKEKSINAIGAEIGSVMSELSSKNATKVRLIDATGLGQSVKSTLKDSTYYVLALSPELNIAVRIIGDHLSIRLEGDLASHEVRIMALGFNIYCSGGYASLHVLADNILLQCKVIGSIVLTLGVQYTVIEHDVMSFIRTITE